MSHEVYQQLSQTYAKRGGLFPGADIPEFYPMAEELWTPDEAAVNVAMPRGFSTAGQVAEIMGRDQAEVGALLEGMADKGLIMASNQGGTMYYTVVPFVPGVFEYQFMRGTKTDRDKRIARLIHTYKHALEAVQGPPKENTFPLQRVITVDQKVKADNVIHTYGQMETYIEQADTISVQTCFCRHEAELIDENDTCGKPNDVCMSFGQGARFLIDRKMARQINKVEAMDVLRRSEEAGLVHCSTNSRDDVDFICNCCKDHCMILKKALAQPKPGLACNSGFQPVVDPDECTACETCVDNCPGDALAIADEEDYPALDPDRCFGCGVCATLCPTEAIELVTRPDIAEPPLDRKSLSAAYKTSLA